MHFSHECISDVDTTGQCCAFYALFTLFRTILLSRGMTHAVLSKRFIDSQFSHIVPFDSSFLFRVLSSKLFDFIHLQRCDLRGDLATAC